MVEATPFEDSTPTLDEGPVAAGRPLAGAQPAIRRRDRGTRSSEEGEEDQEGGGDGEVCCREDENRSSEGTEEDQDGEEAMGEKLRMIGGTNRVEGEEQRERRDSKEGSDWMRARGGRRSQKQNVRFKAFLRLYTSFESFCLVRPATWTPTIGGDASTGVWRVERSAFSQL